MVTFKVSNMKCPMCSGRIEKALEKAGIEAQVILENKTVTVADDVKEKTAEILEDLGFDATAD